MNRKGASLVEVIVAAAVLGIGLVGVAALAGTATRVLVRARAMDQAHSLLASFVDSARVSGGGTVSGSRRAADGVLSWNVPDLAGSAAWVRFEHPALSGPVEIPFVVVSRP